MVRLTGAKHSETFKSRQFGPNIWHIYKHSPASAPEKIGAIKYTPATPVVSWTVSGSNPYLFTVSGHTFKNGDIVVLVGGKPPAGIYLGRPYVVVNAR